MNDGSAISDCAHTTLAVLAGGEGRRMGGPKGVLALDGRPILERLLDRLDWPGPTLLVTAPGREHPPGWRRFTNEVTDPVAGEGPPLLKTPRRTKSSFSLSTCQTSCRRR
jgi:molybdopterin-guanine dinucleotide biosynthesis protein A